MSVFPSVSRLASWAGVSPRNNESAGKREQPHSQGQCVSEDGFGGGGQRGGTNQGHLSAGQIFRP
ncbi:MAG: hypothetical protein DMG30_07660 [Acidobacteria bacterium]|nr:MAG: hypothetical protein DMG30_07660 [Acidobacteriota bacterium]